MIGDRETPLPDEPEECWGPLDAMVRLTPPSADESRPLVWVERYDLLVVCRYTHGGSDEGVTREVRYSSATAALHAFTTAVAKLLSAGYRRVGDDETSRV